MKRPNILFLMSDEHRPDVTGYEGNAVVRTPVLDELARTGVVFNNAYTPSPVCVPGRQCIMSGQLPKTCGCEGWVDLQSGHLTFAGHFARYAYQTICSGKLHHQGVDQMMGWTQRIAGDCTLNQRLIPGAIQEEFDRYGYTVGKWSTDREVKEARVAYGPYQQFDDFATQGAIALFDSYFLDRDYQRSRNAFPLLFKLSLVQPHYPYFTTPELFDYYHNRVDIHTGPLFDHPVLSLSQQGKPVDLNEREIRRATAAYYGMVETIDNRYGMALERLGHLGQDLDDWIIIYTSDHGDMLGEHGIWEKTRFFEGSVRVPLIIRWPKNFPGGRVVEENVNLCDLFATLCDLAGLEIPDGLDSRSLVPFLRGTKVDWNNETVSQNGTQQVMIKRDHLKYQYYGEDIPEVLFDLDDDPGETENRIDHREYGASVRAFRERLASLGHGPNADPHYRNAGYGTN